MQQHPPTPSSLRQTSPSSSLSQHRTSSFDSFLLPLVLEEELKMDAFKGFQKSLTYGTPVPTLLQIAMLYRAFEADADGCAALWVARSPLSPRALSSTRRSNWARLRTRSVRIDAEASNSTPQAITNALLPANRPNCPLTTLTSRSVSMRSRPSIRRCLL